MNDSATGKPRGSEFGECDALTELVQSEARLRTLVAATGVAIICTDDQFRVTEFNPAAERMFGRRRQNVLGLRYSELLPPIVREKVDSDFQLVLQGRSIKLFENVIVDLAGATTVVLWDVRRLVDTDGRAIGVVAVGHDITARHRPPTSPTP